MYRVDSLPNNDNTSNDGYVSYVNCNGDLQSNFLITSGGCFDICVQGGTSPAGTDVSITSTLSTCTTTSTYPTYCGGSSSGGAPGDPNYTLIPLTYLGSLVSYPTVINNNELVPSQWGVIHKPNSVWVQDDSEPLSTAMGNIVVDFTHTPGPAILDLEAFAGSKLGPTHWLWNYFSYQDTNPFIWVSFGIRKVKVLGTTSPSEQSTYDITPIGPHTQQAGYEKWYGTCEEQGVPWPQSTYPQSQCMSILAPAGFTGGRKDNPFGAGINTAFGEGTTGYHKYWQVGHNWHATTKLTLWEEGTYEFLIQVHMMGITAMIDPRDGYVRLV